MRKNGKKGGGFRAHVHNPGEYLVVFIMLVVYFVGLGLWVVIDCLQPIDEKDSQQYSLTFSYWEIDEHSLFLTSPQVKEPFRISGYDDYLTGFDRLIEKCDGNTAFLVWAERIVPDDAEPYYWVYAISSKGEVYRTFEDSNAYRRKDIPFTIGLFSIFLVILFAISGFIYIVGSNPQKFPRWVVYCCFKKNAIDI